MSSTPTAPGGQPPGGFTSLTRKPASNFIVGNVPAPTLAYVPPDGFFRFNILTSQLGIPITVNIRIMRSEDGVVTTSQDVFTTTATGSIDTRILQGVEGFILSATAHSDQLNLRRGQAFVSLQLCRGSSSDLQITQTLLQDYLEQGQTVGFPGGMLRQSTEGPGVINIIGPLSGVAGNRFTVTVPGSKRWRLVCIWAQLSTSAAVANRNPSFFADNGGGVPVFEVFSAVNIPAASNANVAAASGMGSPSGTLTNVLLPLPDNLILVPGDTFNLSALNLQAADQYSSVSYMVEEWLEQ